MKIRPVILCGGAGTRLWPDTKKNKAKQFIDFGNWTLLGKTLNRIKSPFYDTPIISTNQKYTDLVKNHLKKAKIKNYKIILEPAKKNTGPAILSAALTKDIPMHQPLLILSADHLIENVKKFNNAIKKNQNYLTGDNIFIFGIKPNTISDQFGYFFSKKINRNINKVSKFVEKPNLVKAKKIIKNGGYWNSGMFFARKDSIIYNYNKYQKITYKNCKISVDKAKHKKNLYYLNKKSFSKNLSKSFDYSILEKCKKINAIKLDIAWSDLGSWKEICLMYNRKRLSYYKKKNVFFRPWGKYTNFFIGKNFLIKEIYVKPKGILSLQKHFYRSEHWVITQGKAKITLNKKFIYKKLNETIFIPLGAIHRIQNPYTKPLRIIEAQLGSILKETDIVRYEDAYGRVK